MSKTVTTIVPKSDRIVVRRVKPEDKSPGGLIIIPENAKEKPAEGIVLAVGPGGRLVDGRIVNLRVTEGERVLFGKYAGNEVKVNGEEQIIIREDDILGTLVTVDVGMDPTTT